MDLLFWAGSVVIYNIIFNLSLREDPHYKRCRTRVSRPGEDLSPDPMQGSCWLALPKASYVPRAKKRWGEKLRCQSVINEELFIVYFNL